ncbi:DUF4328 domain-containing protein [Bisgaard Taxon 45]
MKYRAENHSKLVLILLGLDIFIHALQIWLSREIIRATDALLLMNENIALHALPKDVAQLFQFNAFLHTVKMVGFVVLGMTILSWIYRAHRFVHTTVNATNIQFTDPACVVYFFLPVANLFMPYKAMKETWLASEHPNLWQNKPTPITLILWWSIWLLRINFGIMLFLVRDEYVTSVKNMNELAFLSIFDSLLAIPLALFFLLIVIQVQQIQNNYQAKETNQHNKKISQSSLVS